MEQIKIQGFEITVVMHNSYCYTMYVCWTFQKLLCILPLESVILHTSTFIIQQFSQNLSGFYFAVLQSTHRTFSMVENSLACSEALLILQSFSP